MMKSIADFFASVEDIPKTSMDKIVSLSTLKSYKKKEFIAKIGEVPSNFYILRSGVVRSYYVDEKGKEYIRHVFIPPSTTGSLGSLIMENPSLLSYDCLTDCEVYEVNFKKFKKLVRKDIHIANLYAKILENIFLAFEDKIYDLTVLDGTQRYLKLKNQIPEIGNLIPQYHIASYLNISPVQLSRIRKELFSK